MLPSSFGEIGAASDQPAHIVGAECLEHRSIDAAVHPLEHLGEILSVLDQHPQPVAAEPANERLLDFPRRRPGEDVAQPARLAQERGELRRYRLEQEHLVLDRERLEHRVEPFRSSDHVRQVRGELLQHLAVAASLEDVECDLQLTRVADSPRLAVDRDRVAVHAP